MVKTIYKGAAMAELLNRHTEACHVGGVDFTQDLVKKDCVTGLLVGVFVSR